MAVYLDLPAKIPAEGASGDSIWDDTVSYLVDIWLDEYARLPVPSQIVETTDSGFSYLFDIAAQRLLAAWGLSHGKHLGERPASRMAGAPKGGDMRYHRGHAIPHTLGGSTDINLVPQLGSINVGPFRKLEIQAVATPGALYFTHWTYHGAPSVKGLPGQRPTGVDQGLLIPGKAPQLAFHTN